MDPNATPTATAPDPYDEMVQAFRQSLQPAHPPAVSTPSVIASTPIARPQCYSGEPEGCSGFLLQCSLFIEAYSQSFPNDISKIAFVMSLLTGRALQWAEALWNGKSTVLASMKTFFTQFCEVFGVALTPLSVHDELIKLKQAKNNIHDYTLRFLALAASSGWNDVALLAAYRKGLQPTIRRQMAIYEDTVSLESFIKKAIHISQHLSACAPDTSLPRFLSPVSATSPEGEDEPMITDTYRLSPSERTRRMQNHLCLYCGEPNHIIRNCPVRPQRPAVSTVRLTPSVSNIPHIPADLFNSYLFPVHVLVDSGVARNSISSQCLTDFKTPDVESETFYQISTIQGTPLGDGRISRRTVELKLILNGNHSEKLTLLVLPRATVDVILGRPWLTRHSPHIDWRSGEILGWSDACEGECLVTSSATKTTPKVLPVQSTSVESPETTSSVTIPSEYASYADIFSKEQATHLPLHRQWDCSIDLLPGARLPQGKVYPLSIPKREAMENYINETLKQGFIRPSTSPAASIPAALEELREAHVFTKLDLCSAYNLIRIREGDWKTAFITPLGHYEYLVMPYGLANSPSVFQNFMNEIFRDFLHHFVIVYIDDILIYSHDLQEHRNHVLQVLQRLREHQLFLKLEKCEFHQSSVSFLGYVISGDGVRMEQSKVSVVSQWKEPISIKDLQRFLGFANFYRRFIKNFSLLTTPRTALLKGTKKTLQWNSNAREAFHNLKQAFTSSPVLQHPDPNKPFVVEVDAADTGVGAVLSQWSGEPLALHPCAYYSKKLTPAEQNYGIGDHELLAIKLALKEWRHWLGGAKHPFQVITDHKNLQYLQNAKRLNARQYRWSMLFTCFRFHITYQPSHKNSRADALSRMHSSDPVDENPEPILPPSDSPPALDPHRTCKLIPLKGLPTALETAEALFQNVFRNFGLPEDIVSDRGPQFISRVWRAFFQLLGVTVSLSSGYHPQTNGQTERKIQEISRYLRYQPPLFPWSDEASEVPAVDHWFWESERVWDSAHVHLQRAVRRYKENTNVRRLPTPTHHPGDKVWLSTCDMRLRLPCKKLSPCYIGPFTIYSQINAATYRLNLPPQYQISSSFHVSLLKAYIDPVLPPPTEPELPPPPPQPEIIGDQIYRIQEILQSRRRGRPAPVPD
ncbi:Transposon Tf2-9 polyprotein [Labeo rohita]|uniref:ribonuclease H n=1 Tax=Labeo rohita TaxID=84645 RepID=A0ABQ8LB34_LABRO|nr:Transposon Tf2-9 polyprotein [Labeo rohita]